MMMSDCLLLQDELDYEPDDETSPCEPTNDNPHNISKTHVVTIKKDHNRNGLRKINDSSLVSTPVLDSTTKSDLIKEDRLNDFHKVKPVEDDLRYISKTDDFSDVDLNNAVLLAHGGAKPVGVQNNNDETFKLSSFEIDAVKIETSKKKPFLKNDSSGVDLNILLHSQHVTPLDEQNNNDKTFKMTRFENNDPAKTILTKKTKMRKKKLTRPQPATFKIKNEEMVTKPDEKPPSTNTLPRPRLAPMNFCISFSTNSATRMIQPKVLQVDAPLKAEPVAEPQSTDIFNLPEPKRESISKTIQLNMLQETEPLKAEPVQSQSILTDLYGPPERRAERFFSKKVWTTKYMDRGGVQLSSRDSVISWESDEEPPLKRQRLESCSSLGSLKLSLRRPPSTARSLIVEPSTSSKIPLDQTADEGDDLLSIFAETVSDREEKEDGILEPNMNCNNPIGKRPRWSAKNDDNQENFHQDVFPEMVSNGQAGSIEKRFNEATTTVPLVFKRLCYYHFFNLNGKTCYRNPCFHIHNLYPLTPAINNMHCLTEVNLLEAYNFARIHPKFFTGLLPKFLQSFAIKKMFDQMIAIVEHIFDPALLSLENYNQLAMLRRLCQAFVDGHFANFYGSVQFIIDKCLENIPRLGDTMANLIIDLPDLPNYWPLVKEIILAQKLSPTTGERLLLTLTRFSLEKKVAEDIFKSALKLKFIDTNKYQNRMVLKHFMEVSAPNGYSDTLQNGYSEALHNGYFETLQPSSQLNATQQNQVMQRKITGNNDPVFSNCDRQLGLEIPDFNIPSLSRIEEDSKNVASDSTRGQPTSASLSESQADKNVNFVSSYTLCESWLQKSCTAYDPNAATNSAQALNADTSSSSDSDSTTGSSETVRAESDGDIQAQPQDEQHRNIPMHVLAQQEGMPRRLRYNQEGSVYDPLNDYVSPIPQPNDAFHSEAIVSSTSDVRLANQNPPEQPKFGQPHYDSQYEFNVSLHNMYLKKLDNVDINEEDVFRLNEAIEFGDGDLFLELLHKYRSHNTIQNFITMTLADLRNMKQEMADSYESLLQSIETRNPKYYGDRITRVTLEVITMNLLFELDHRLKYKEADKLLQRFTDWDSLISAKLLFTLKTLSPISRLLFIAKLVCHNRPQLTFEILYAPRLHLLDHYNSWPYPNSPLPTYEVLEYDLKFRNAVLKMFLKDAYVKNISVVIEFYKIAFNRKEGIFKFDEDLSEYFDNMIVDIINKNEVVYLKQIQANIGLFSGHMLSETLRGYVCCMYSTLTKLELFKLYEQCVNKNIYPCVNRNGKVETEILMKTNLLDTEIQLIILYFFHKLTESDRTNSNLKIVVRQPNAIPVSRLNILNSVRSIGVINKVIKDTLLKSSVKSSSDVLEEIVIEKRALWNYLDENRFG